MLKKKIKVVFFQRKPSIGSFSLEYIFEDVRRRLPKKFEVIKAESTFFSRGIFKRLFNILEAMFRQGDVNHITGDVHFLTFGMQKSKTILTILDCVFLNEKNDLKRWILKTFWMTLPVKKATMLTAISEATKKQILSYVNIDPAKIRVIHVAISPDFHFKPKPFDTNRPKFLHIGMAPNKNLERVIEALEGLPLRMIIIGKLSDNNCAKLKEFNIEYENYFNLSNEAVQNLYAESDALLFASTYEGFGMPILEAQATGRPVITSNLLSMPEVAGDAACFVDPFDISSIRAGVQKVMKNEVYRTELIQKGLLNIKRFDPDVIAGEYAALYEEVLSNKKLFQ
jgi:glycosyltransferase involved in cell wall biosynthesis